MTVKEFREEMDVSQLRHLLNVEGAANKTASSTATGAKKRGAGDYMYWQDRGSFDALLADIKSGDNESSWTNLYELALKILRANESLRNKLI